MIINDSYIATRSKTRPGFSDEQQLKYTEHANQTVLKVVDLIREKKPFGECIELCKTARKEWAVVAGHPQANEYECERENVSHFATHTLLHDPRYMEHTDQIYRNLEQLNSDWSSKGANCGDSDSNFKLEEITPSKMKEIYKDLPQAKEDELEEKFDLATKENIRCYNAKYKEKYPNEYLNNALKIGIEYLNKYNPIMKNATERYYQGVSRYRINGKMIAMTRLIFRVDVKEEGAYPTTKESPYPTSVLLLHQDRHLLHLTKKAAEEAFLSALNWSEDLGGDELLKRIGTLRYLLAHGMFRVRGSASEAEVIEAALLRYHGFEQAHQSPEYSLDLDALISFSFTRFLDIYRKAIILGEKSAKNSNEELLKTPENNSLPPLGKAIEQLSLEA